ncbi:MAG: hypothetical protein ACLUBS_08405 [Parabacteroides distasonis]|uniref:hypothetical protein n=1 Tax=Parabacteroides distasonis TaxID=823 RepID=UPI000EFDD46A|nr:hypothetical protein [Parabacteroides distasonis]RHM51594.1 hypothetical protein DWZ58_19570 [Parabacteroides distasonis]
MKKCLKLFEEYCQNAVSKENFNSDGTILDMSKIIQQKIEFLKKFNTEGTAYANSLLVDFEGDKEKVKQEILKISTKYVQNIL